MSNNIEFPRFLNNDPCGIDLFESGSQKRTAASIASYIKTGTSYKLIGLDGSWGAGKSNVISIIQKELGKAYHQFIYDAWSHQEDLQRRSFLEELTEDLSRNNVINPHKWNAKLKDLLAKKKETITKTIPKISPAYYFIFGCLALLPVGKELADIIDKEYIFWRLIVSIAPLLLLVITWGIVIIFVNKEYRKADKLLAIYNEKDLHKTINETISEKEPTVREFRHWMADLDHDLQKETVIVFDNMDRLPPEKVQILWSSIHTFFSENSYNKIWVIVPFDRKHIKDAFKDDSDKSNHFINKTFSVIFSVSPAVLTDWWSFFKIKFTEAFGDTENTEYNIVKSIFDRYQDRITPRKIIAFINELVSLKLIWKEEILLRYMAIFVLNKEDILEDPTGAILIKRYLERGKLLFRDEENISDKIAALVYNIPVSTASQVTLQREILVTIRNKNTGKLKELINHRDFYKILEEVFIKEEIDIEPSVFTINTLDDITELDNDKQVIKDIWDIIAARQLIAPIDDQLFTDTFRILLLKASSSYLTPLASYILREFSNSRNFKASTYFKATDDMNSFIDEKKLPLNVTILVGEKELEAEMFIEYVNMAKDRYAKYNVICKNENLDNFLLDKASDNWRGCEILPFISTKYTFPKLKRHVEGIIEANNITKDDIEKVFSVYKAISDDKPLSKKLSDQIIHNLFTQAVANTPLYYELAAMRLGRTDQFTNFGGLSQTILTSTDQSLINHVAKTIEYYTDYGNLLQKSVSWPQPLLNEVTKKITINPVGVSRMNIEKVLPLFEQIIDSVKVTADEMFNRLTPWREHLKLTVDNLPELLPGLIIFDTAIKIDNKLSGLIKKTAGEYIESVEPETWNISFKNESSYPFKLLHFILRNGIISGLPHKSIDAFKEALLSIANDENQITVNNPAAWKEFYEQSDKRQLKGTIKNIRDIFINKSDILPEKFIFFESALRSHGNLDDKGGEVVRRILTPVIQDAACLQLILSHKEFYVSLVSKSGDDKLDFIKDLRKKVEEGPDNNLLTAFAREIDKSFETAIVIHEARYFTEENSNDVTSIVKEKVEKEQMYHFKITNEALNADPHPGIQKKFEIKYEYDGKDGSEILNENEWLNLP